jgi:hypothetical protein
MLVLYVVMALAVIGIGAGVAHLADPHDGGVRGVWTAVDEHHCNVNGCVWLGLFTAPGGTDIHYAELSYDEPAHLIVGASFPAYLHDGGSDDQWVEIPHPFSGWWLLGPGVLVLIGAVLVWWRRDRLDADHPAAGKRLIPLAYDLLPVPVGLAVVAGLIELIELCWPGHGWHYGQIWVIPIGVTGRILLEKFRVRRYGPERVAATRAYDWRGGRRMWGWTMLLAVAWAAVALAVLGMSVGINFVLTDDLAEAWPCAGAVAVTVALAVAVAALTARVVRRRRDAVPTAGSDVEQTSAPNGVAAF